jgi:hypothetical protein
MNTILVFFVSMVVMNLCFYIVAGLICWKYPKGACYEFCRNIVLTGDSSRFTFYASLTASFFLAVIFHTITVGV